MILQTSDEPSVMEYLALTRLITEFGWIVDHKEGPEAFSRLFTDDAQLSGPGFELHGLGEIMDHARKQATRDRISRHDYGALRITETGDDIIRGCVLVTAHFSETIDGTPKTSTGIADSFDLFRRERGLWKFAERKLEVVF